MGWWDVFNSSHVPVMHCPAPIARDPARQTGTLDRGIWRIIETISICEILTTHCEITLILIYTTNTPLKAIDT